MNENELSGKILDTCLNIHYNLGPGLFESVYEEILFFELTNQGLHVERQKPVPLVWQTLKMEAGFRMDLIIENKVVIEIKSIEALHQVHFKQVQTYLKLTGCKLGLLINFNVFRIKQGFHRIANNL